MRTVLIAVAMVLGAWLILIGLLFAAGRGETARQAAALLPNLVFLFHGLVRDPRVPRATKLLLLGGMAWIASPIDLVPEFIPILGPLDDAIIAVLILRRVARVAGKAVLADHWRGDPDTLEKLFRLARI